MQSFFAQSASERTTFVRGLLIFLLGNLFFCPLAFAALSPEAEATQCRENLRLIFDAIQRFRRENKDLPDDLPQLVPKCLSDPKALICPAAKRLGTVSSDVSAIGVGRAVRGSSYVYEFRRTPIPEVIAGGSSRTMREWKQLQMTLLGSEVPMVRCHNHARDLNLSFGGPIYESTSDFEDKFADLVPIEELVHHKLFERFTIRKVIRIPERPPSASKSLIDLSDHYNASLKEGWSSQNKGNNLENLPAGVVQLEGREYDIRGVIQLGARSYEFAHFPSAVTNIAVNANCRGLAFLHGTIQEAELDRAIGSYVIHYDDGKIETIPILYGKHLLNWWSDPTKSGRNERLLDSAVAWQGTNPARTAEGKDKLVYLYRTSWTNPRLDVRVKSIDFISAQKSSAPFLVALSVEATPAPPENSAPKN
jgi:hypothetical protein